MGEPFVSSYLDNRRCQAVAVAFCLLGDLQSGLSDNATPKDSLAEGLLLHHAPLLVSDTNNTDNFEKYIQILKNYRKLLKIHRKFLNTQKNT